MIISEFHTTNKKQIKNERMKNKSQLIIIVGALLLLISQNSYSQIKRSDLQLNTITTAVPFLQIVPDARGGSMGDVGVATTPDNGSMFFNPAKYSFAEKKMGVAISYVPWLKKLVNDINLGHLGGFYKIDKSNTIAASLRYFSLGNITFTNEDGVSQGDYQPHEYSFDLAWSRLLSKNFSMAIAGRYIYSNLTLGQYVGGESSKAGQSVAADIALYYRKPLKISGVKKTELAFGMNISNIGAKISYTQSTRKDFIPTNLRLGTAINLDIDEHNSFSLGVDFNKLLVPTPPIYQIDSLGNNAKDPSGNYIIESGMDPNVSIVSGMFQSFYDAPGGFKEEMREINWSVGLEYWYEKRAAIRMGYFYENQTKGDRQYFTAGIGLRYLVFGIDAAYLVAVKNNNPLANTIRFTLSFDFDALAKQQN